MPRRPRPAHLDRLLAPGARVGRWSRCWSSPRSAWPPAGYAGGNGTGGSPATTLHLSEGAWAELRATALDLGLEWPDHRSPREQARTVSEQVTTPPEDVGSLEGLLLDVERGRYARPGAVGTIGTVAPEERAHTVETVTAWRRSMLASVDRGRGWRGRLWPSSLLRRRP